jgi:chaperonin GroEL (HSP60 family)
MSVSVSAFRWLDILEKEFDKAFVDLDLLLGEIDQDQVEITDEGRAKMTMLSSCFAQLTHKAQTISQANAKLEVNLFFSFISFSNKFKIRPN